MIKHIVFFRFSDKQGNPERLPVLKSKIEALKDSIPEIEHIEAGINISNRPQAYDLALISDFRSEEDLEKYRVHPDHQALIEFLKSFDYEVAVADYVYH